jgi:hypothetical protein
MVRALLFEIHMRTTVRLDDALLQQAKREAASRHLSLKELIEHGLRLVLAQSRLRRRRRRVTLPRCSVGGGLLPGVDLDSSAVVLDVMEGSR